MYHGNDTTFHKSKEVWPMFFLNCGKRLDLKAAKQAVAYTCSKNITFGENQTVIKHFPVIWLFVPTV